MRLVTTGFLILFFSSAVCSAQTRDEDSLLGGPKVADGAGAPTIVERDFEGKVKRLEVRPEEAAAMRLQLTEEERRAVDRVLAERAASMDAAIVGNVELLTRLASARAANDREALRGLMEELRGAFGELAQPGKLVEDISAVLPAEKAEELRAMVRGYYEAVIAEAAQDARRTRDSGGANEAMGEQESGGDGSSEESDSHEPMTDNPRQRRGLWRGGRAGSERQLLAAESLRVFGQEIRASYDRVIGQATQRLDAMLSQLNLTGEQDSKIRNLITEFGQKTRLNPTAQQKAELFRAVWAQLNSDQRGALAAQIRG